MSEELKPCPFCGSDELLGFEPSYEGGWTLVKCRKCGCSGPSKLSESEVEAAALWNTRPAPAEDVSAVVDEPVAWAQNTDLSAIGSGALWSGTLWGRANPPILPNRSPLYTHPRRPVVMPEPEAFERMVIEHFGFGPSQLCLLSGRDLKVIFDACIDEFGRLNPEIPK